VTAEKEESYEGFGTESFLQELCAPLQSCNTECSIRHTATVHTVTMIVMMVMMMMMIRVGHINRHLSNHQQCGGHKPAANQIVCNTHHTYKTRPRGKVSEEQEIHSA
jgi:hypothetical protein